MRILYLTFFESVTHNGIYETQVKQLLCKLATEYAGQITLSHYAILPAMEVGRKGPSVPIVAERRGRSTLKGEFQACGVNAAFIFLPVIILKRWTAKSGFLLVSLLLTLSLPALLYRMLRERQDIVHCRSYAATILALAMKLVFRDLKVVFDPRGFWPEEGVVTRRWKEGSLTFRVWKQVERYLLRRSDKVIALSEAFAKHIAEITKGANCALIYASADIQKFTDARKLRDVMRRELGLEGTTVFVYNGGLQEWHDPHLLGYVFRAIHQTSENVKLLVLTTYKKTSLEAVFQGAGLNPEDFQIVAAEPHDVPSYLGACDYGIVPLREISESGAMTVVAETMIGTKVAEYLACGLPIIVNKHAGGLKSLMEQYRIGTFFDSKNLAGITHNIRHMKENYNEYQRQCESVAARYLSLDQAAQSYYRVYKEILRTKELEGELETAKVGL